MKIKIQCDKKKDGCGSTYEVEIKNVEMDRYIQCPFCARISPNPLYKGEK